MTALEILRSGGDFRRYGKLVAPLPPSEADLDKAWLVAREASALLKEEFGATRVVLYGSLARKDFFDAISDIDLAAWGIPDKFYFKAVARLDDFGAPWEINLESGESIGSQLAEAISRHGVDL